VIIIARHLRNTESRHKILIPALEEVGSSFGTRVAAATTVIKRRPNQLRQYDCESSYFLAESLKILRPYKKILTRKIHRAITTKLQIITIQLLLI
jgi:hypothetical protein